MSNHRKPPKPEHYHTKGKGACRQCGGEILNKKGEVNKRASWHPHCVKEYRLIHFPSDTRRAVYRRDRGVCGYCGIQCGRSNWDVEHVRPLFEANGDIEYWKLTNIKTSCKPCHKAKSKEEAGIRAAARRAAKDNEK